MYTIPFPTRRTSDRNMILWLWIKVKGTRSKKKVQRESIWNRMASSFNTRVTIAFAAPGRFRWRIPKRRLYVWSEIGSSVWSCCVNLKNGTSTTNALPDFQLPYLLSFHPTHPMDPKSIVKRSWNICVILFLVFSLVAIYECKPNAIFSMDMFSRHSASLVLLPYHS
jgi:hypothetical protein